MAKPHNCQCHSGFTCGACLARAPAYHFTPTRETFAEYCARPHPERDEKPMAKLTFNLVLQRHGVDLKTGDVDAQEAGIVGDWFEGKPYKPHPSDVLRFLPAQFWGAFNRNPQWWETRDGTRKIPLKCELRNLAGKLIGTIYAIPNWSE